VARKAEEVGDLIEAGLLVAIEELARDDQHPFARKQLEVAAQLISVETAIAVGVPVVRLAVVERVGCHPIELASQPLWLGGERFGERQRLDPVVDALPIMGVGTSHWITQHDHDLDVGNVVADALRGIRVIEVVRAGLTGDRWPAAGRLQRTPIWRGRKM
jgi:hypothetical protein